MVGAKYNESCRDFFKEHNILTLACIYIYKVSLLIYKIKLSFLLIQDLHDHNTRNKDNFFIPISKLKVVKNSPDRIGLQIFNKLPESLKSVDTEKKFKKDLKLFFLQHCFYNLNEFMSL